MKRKLSQEETNALINLLKVRFEANKVRHKGIVWPDVLAKLTTNEDKLWSINAMEQTGGEPDVVDYDKNTNEYLFFDCCAESPKGRRSICYDHEALEARKENKPSDSATGMAKDMGITLLTEAQYRTLQTLGKFDLKTSSWVQTPKDIRQLGGAVFCDRRYNTVFLYHNGAESYYAARGFRGMVSI